MQINEKVTVGMVNNAPKYIIWQGRCRNVSKIGLHHHYRQGKTLYHIFSVVSETLFMRLRLNTDSLNWVLEEINDETSL